MRIFGSLGNVIGSRHIIELEDKGVTIRALIKIIQRQTGQSRRRYLCEFLVGGADLAIIVNGKNIALSDGLDTILHNEDHVVITPYVSGGDRG